MASTSTNLSVNSVNNEINGDVNGVENLSLNFIILRLIVYSHSQYSQQWVINW